MRRGVEVLFHQTLRRISIRDDDDDDDNDDDREVYERVYISILLVLPGKRLTGGHLS